MGIKTKDKRVAFCSSHKKKHLAEERDGAEWSDRKPICPDCEWSAGYQSGVEDALMNPASAKKWARRFARP